MKPFPVLILAFGLGACAELDLPPLDFDLPAGWDQAPAAAGTPVQWPDTAWWQGFGSAELNDLVAAAQADSPDLAAAAARVAQAEAQLAGTGASLFPAIDADAGASRRIPGKGRATNSVSAGVSASYQLDLFGELAAGVSAARAQLAGSRYDRETVALTVTTSVATSYLAARSLGDRLAIARHNLADAQTVMKLVQARFDAGAASELELAQQRGVVAQNQAAIPPLDQALVEARNALALLLGRPPEGFAIAGTSLAGITLPPVVAGLPSDLLTRRPDLKRAEADLAAAQADIAAARAAFFPSISLTASADTVSNALSGLFQPQSLLFALAGSVVETIFDGGRREAQSDLAKARRDEIVQAYRKAILAAFGDVENGLSRIATLATQRHFQDQQVAEARRALDLATERYRAGAIDLIELLDAQRSLYQAQDTQNQLKLASLNAVISLYAALGGGWAAAGT